ncbi:hypothetical protein [Burkholderia glumae]|uniref:hypothetical protein n=1 Tax=Burkholderia glumae TaxID=337 RepID=UPI00148ECFD5|nr:hypothetical protein [Burkholderia glumae]QJW78728.1 hypothetical protein GAS18_08150 [Burkholderia glumae]
MNQWKQPHGEHSLASGIPAALMPAGITRYWEIGEHHELMQQLQSFLDTVLETNQIPFDIQPEYGREHAVRNPVGVAGYRSLSGLLPSCGRWMDLYWPGYAYSADLQLFFDCFMQHPFARVFSAGHELPAVDKAYAANLYNDFVCCLRTETVRRGVRKTLGDARANLRDQAVSIGRYLGELVSRYKSLVPVRVDFYYQQDAFEADDAMPRGSWTLTHDGGWMPVASDLPMVLGRPETRARFDTAVAMAHRDNFFANQRGADTHLFERKVGHVCKLERGGRSGANHFHCIFLIDGQRLSDVDIQALKFGLGDRWRRVTAGQGIMFDCHDGQYRRSIKPHHPWVIDRLDCTNIVQVARFIDYIVGYFAKDGGQTVRIKPTPKAQTLTKGR